jgi:hypothetical protein
MTVPLMDKAPAIMEHSQAGKDTSREENRRAKDGKPTRKVNAGIMTNISPRTPMYISRKINTDSRFAITTTPVNANYLALLPELMRARVAGSLDTCSPHAPAKERKEKTRRQRAKAKVPKPKPRKEKPPKANDARHLRGLIERAGLSTATFCPSW